MSYRLINRRILTLHTGCRIDGVWPITFTFGRLNSPALTEPVPVFPTNIPGCNITLSDNTADQTDSGAFFFTMSQVCPDGSVEVRYVMTDGAFRKDLVVTTRTSTSFPNLRASLFTPPGDCDDYLYIPFVNKAPKTGFETDPADRIVPVSDTGVTNKFQASYLTVPDSIGGLTGQGVLGLPALQ